MFGHLLILPPFGVILNAFPGKIVEWSCRVTRLSKNQFEPTFCPFVAERPGMTSSKARFASPPPRARVEIFVLGRSCSKAPFPGGGKHPRHLAAAPRLHEHGAPALDEPGCRGHRARGFI